jgi:hypothetical protein
MLAMLGLITLVAALMRFSPDGLIAAALRRALIEAPVRALSRLSRGRLVFFALLVVIGFALASVVGVEGLHLFGLALPDLIVWFTVFDVGVFIDALLIAGTILTARSPGVVKTWLAPLTTAITAVVARYSARARRPLRRPPSSGDDGDDGEGRGRALQPAGYRLASMA